MPAGILVRFCKYAVSLYPTADPTNIQGSIPEDIRAARGGGAAQCRQDFEDVKEQEKASAYELACLPDRTLVCGARPGQGLISLKANKNKLSVTTKWTDLVEDQSIFIARYSGSKRSFQLGPKQQMQLFWDTLRLNASADLDTDVLTDLDGNIITSKLHTEKGHQGLNLPRPKRTELGQFGN